MNVNTKVLLLAGVALVAGGFASGTLAADESLDDAVIVVEEGDDGADATIEIDEGEAHGAITPEDGGSGEDAIVIEPDEDAGAAGREPQQATAPAVAGQAPPPTDGARVATAGFQARTDKLRLEYSPLVGSDESVDAVGYGNAELSLGWSGSSRWEARLAGRADGYLQTGDPTADEAELDYGESYLRYRGDDLRLTVGTQTVIWGRIDEIPPTDRLSVQDLSRFILDDLQDRRRARPMVRVEGFAGENKLDLLWTPTFRGAELPEKDSIWYPIDRRRGEVLGLPGDPLLRQVVRGALIDDDAPDSDNGFGLRFSRTEAAVDYALTVQQARQSTPYFRYDIPRNTLEARYPSAWSLGGDIGVEAGGAIWRLEAAWISDVPATREDYRYVEVEGVNWAAGVEFFPGDGDARVNLQLAASTLYDTTDVLDRTDVYNFNGALELPFAQDRWRAKVRFFAGLDERDVYVNPEIVFLGWQPHSLYVEAHWFDGDDGTLGGFHDQHSLVSLGWRAEF